MNDNSDKSTAQLIEEIRFEAQQTSQKQVANRLKCSCAYVHDILNDRRDLSAKVAYRLGYVPILKWRKK